MESGRARDGGDMQSSQPSIASDIEEMRSPLLTNKSMGKVYFTHNIGQSRLGRLLKLPAFRTSALPLDPALPGTRFPTRMKALDQEIREAQEYFKSVLVFVGFAPRDTKRFGWFWTAICCVGLGVAWPIYTVISEEVVAQDKRLKDLWSEQHIYRLVLFLISLYWMSKQCRKHSVESMLFLEEGAFSTDFSIKRVARSKGLGGLWMYASIVKNFGLELLCLFVPYFTTLIVGRAWWSFIGPEEQYSVRYRYPSVSRSSPLWLQLLYYFLSLLSIGYTQVVFLIPCIYFRAVSGLVLLEMKAYKSMVQPERRGLDQDEGLSKWDDISMNDKLNDLAAQTGAYGSFQEEGDVSFACSGSPVRSRAASRAGSCDKPEAGASPSSFSSARRAPPRSPRAGLRVNPFSISDDGSMDSDAAGQGPKVSIPVLREHGLLQKVLKDISHRFRALLLFSFLVVFLESFVTLYFLLVDFLGQRGMPRAQDRFTAVGIAVRLELGCSALLHSAGLVLNLRAILIMTHRLQAIQNIASEQHALLTCGMDLSAATVAATGLAKVAGAGGAQGGWPKALAEELEGYMKRRSLLEYMEAHPLGVTIYGFLIDREFLRSFHMVIVSLAVFVISLVLSQRS